MLPSPDTTATALQKVIVFGPQVQEKAETEVHLLLQAPQAPQALSLSLSGKG
jgi:hypothetical protein